MRLVAVGRYYNVHQPFMKLFDSLEVIGFGNSVELKKGDVVLFGGGEDISPSLYKQKPSRYCGATERLSQRDILEKSIFEQAKLLNIPMIGVCRGAQLLCALNGGSLYQHVNNHAGRDHDMITNTGDILNVCSVHHQMMNPMGTKHELLAWSSHILSNVHLIENEENLAVDVEPEVVYFTETKSLAIQYHPEFMSDDDLAVEYSRNLVSKFIIGDLNATVL